MSTENELKELMGLVGALAQDTALYIGNVVQINKVETSAKVLEDRLRVLLNELEAAREDAARYRWLRDIGDDTWTPFCKRTGYSIAEFDKAIDAARKGEA